MDCKKYKILIVGDSNVGKSSLINSYVYDMSISELPPTIGIDYKTKVLDQQNISLQLYDTGGQDKFRSIVNSYYNNSNVIIFTFAMDNLKSLQELDEYWIPHSKEMIEKYHITPYLILVGNKCDIPKDTSILFYINNIKKKYNLEFIETSTINFINIYSLFDKMLDNIIKPIENKYLVVNTHTINDNYVDINKLNNKNINTNCC